MKAKTVLKETISTALEGNSLDNVVTRGSGFKNLLKTFIRKLTSQKFRINIPSYTSFYRKVFYYSKIFSIDYLNYVYEKNPDIPRSY
jgi:hypothetical protein